MNAGRSTLASRHHHGAGDLLHRDQEAAGTAELVAAAVIVQALLQTVCVLLVAGQHVQEF